MSRAAAIFLGGWGRSPFKKGGEGGGFGRLGAAPLVALLLLACPSSPPPDVPDPDTSGMEPRVRQRLAEARSAVVEEPGSADAWGRLGRVADAHELDEVAVACYRQASELAPEDVRWPYFLGRLLAFKGTDLEAAIGLFRRVLELDSGYAPAHLRLADALTLANDLDAAEASYRRAIELDPDLARAHVGLGQVLLRQDRAEEAVPPLERAHTLVGDDATALFALGQAWRRLGDRERAAVAAEKARGLELIDSFPDPWMQEVSAEGMSSTVLVERAVEYLRLGRFRQAVRTLKLVEEARPDDPYVHRDLGRAYSELGKPEAAIPHLEKALALKGDLVDARALLGLLLIETQQLDEAIDHLRQARAASPEDPALAAAIASVLARRGDLDAALTGFERAAALGPLAGPAHLEWGSALAQKGRFAEAEALFRKALESDPQSAQVLFNLGLACEAQGRAGEAVGHYRRVMEIEPNPLAAGRLRALGQG